MNSILEEIMKDINAKKAALVEGLREEISSYKRLVFHSSEPGMDNGYYILCKHPEDLVMELERGGQDVTHDPKAWDYYNAQEAEFNPGAQFGTFEECYDILDTKTNKKMNAKSYKNKKKALGRVESANIAHGTPRYTLKINEAYTNLDPATEVSPDQLSRLQDKWSLMAGEPVKIKVPSGSNGPIYAFGSESACKQLLSKLKIGQVNLAKDKWYYCNK